MVASSVVSIAGPESASVATAPSSSAERIQFDLGISITFTCQRLLQIPNGIREESKLLLSCVKLLLELRSLVR